MTAKPPIPMADEMLHSHSDLTRQLDELEAHARTLRCADGDKSEVLDDLANFARHFAGDVEEHIIEEEEILFPRCHPYLTASSRTLLHRIRNQHRDLERSLRRFMQYLDDAQQQRGELQSYLVEAIYLRARLLRFSFAVHSDEERRFFEEVFDL